MNNYVAKFNTGQIVCTDRVGAVVENNPEFAAFVSESMRKHVSGDWGDLDAENKQFNEDGLDAKNPERLLSAYNFQQLPGVRDTKIWIVTEWDRSVTTVLFPSEY